MEADTLHCDFCKSRVIMRVPAAATCEEVATLAAKVVSRLDTAHKEECGWRGNVCPVSVARFPRLPDERLREDFKARCAALAALPSLPRVAAPSSAALGSVAGGASGPPPPPGTSRRVALLVAEMEPLAGPAAEAVVLLALCGWQVQSVPYVVDREPGGGLWGGGAGVEAGVGPGRLGPHPHPRPTGKAAAAGDAAKVGGLVLSCQLCEARAAGWNFARGETPKPSAAAAAASGGSAVAAIAPAATTATVTAADATAGQDAKKKAKVVGTALMVDPEP